MKIFAGSSSAVNRNQTSRSKFLDPRLSKLWNRAKCMESNWSLRNNTHPTAPITFMPPANQLLMPFSYKVDICNSTALNLRLIFVPSRVKETSLRNAIRNTYADFDSYANSSLKGNWSLFFVVGKPTDELGRLSIERETKKFGDVIAVNISEGYYRQTVYKILIALKVVTCFCPNADYVIKVDDDTYIRMKKFDKMIVGHQEMVDKGTAKKVEGSGTEADLLQGHLNFFTGSVCNTFRVYRGGIHAISREKFPDNNYPFYCYGGFYLYTMQSVHKLALDCPHHCVGQKLENFEQNRNKFCVHEVDDIFFGSCVSLTQQNETVLSHINKKLGIYVTSPDEIDNRTSSSHLAVHFNKKSWQMTKTHHFYKQKELLY